MITFRTAQVEDADKISQLVNSAYRGDEAKKGWTTEAYILDGQRTDLEKILEMILDRNASIELAIGNNVILGCVYILKEPSNLYFGMLTVKPELQNKGVGRLLLSHVEELAKSWGFKKIRMTVIRGRKELIEYYERRGYKETGNTEAFPEDPRYGIPKTKLVLNEFEKILSE